MRSSFKTFRSCDSSSPEFLQENGKTPDTANRSSDRGHEIKPLDQIIGTSASIRRVRTLIRNSAKSSASILITGESGTGKELVAKAIHHLSQRAKRPYIVVHCGGLPETLLESELFGFERGAFTGADAPKRGLLEAADRGTCFLDEISETTPAFQVKLLRTLEEGEVRRIGATSGNKFDIRFISASNKILEEEVRLGEFREDLFYRIQTITIHLDPLRRRTEDIPLLARRFLAIYNQRYQAGIEEISQEAMEIMIKYPWQGNVRELQHVIERGVVLSTGRIFQSEHLSEEIRAWGSTRTHPGASSPTSLMTLDEMRREHIMTVLNFTHWNKTRAAQILGISRPTLERSIKRYRLSRKNRTHL